MVSRPRSPTRDDLRAAYGAVVDYHNNLVHMRFTVAGLFLAANGFLVSGYLQKYPPPFPLSVLPYLGIVLASICWLLEVRTYQLLNNLGARGIKLEKQLDIDQELGFFSLMAYQPIGPRFLITRIRLRSNRVVRYVFSHSFGIGLLYSVIALFWIYMLYVTA